MTNTCLICKKQYTPNPWQSSGTCSSECYKKLNHSYYDVDGELKSGDFSGATYIEGTNYER